MNGVNEFEFSGRIVRLTVDSGRYDAAHVVLRLPSERDRSKSDYPNISFFGRELTEKVSAFKVGDDVTIKGHIQTKRSEIGGFSLAMLTGDSITALENNAAVKLGANAPRGLDPRSVKNEILLRGQLVYKTVPANGKVVLFTVRVRDENGHVARPKMTGFGPIIPAVVEIELDTEICVIAAYHSYTKEINGEKRYFDDLVVSRVFPAVDADGNPVVHPTRERRRTNAEVERENMPLVEPEEEDVFASNGSSLDEADFDDEYDE